MNNTDCIGRRVVFACVLMMFGAMNQAALAEEPDQTMIIKWGAVKGAADYLAQWRAIGSEKTDERRVGEGEITLRLPVGRFQLRVAALNKFGKPAAWSDWKSFDVKMQAQPAVVDLAKSDPNPAAKDTDAADKGARKPARKEPVPFLVGLIPGVPQFFDYNQTHGTYYWGAFAALAAFGLRERSQALALRNDLFSDPSLIGYAALSNYPLADPTNALRLAYWVTLTREHNRGAYERHRNNLNATALVSVLFYLFHFFEWRAMEAASATVIEGARLEVEFSPSLAGRDRTGTQAPGFSVLLRITL